MPPRRTKPNVDDMMDALSKIADPPMPAADDVVIEGHEHVGRFVKVGVTCWPTAAINIEGSEGLKMMRALWL